MLSLPSNIEPRPDKILNVHSHLSTTLTPFNSDVPFFKTLILSGLMILPKNVMMLNELSTWFKKNISLWKYYEWKADFYLCDVLTSFDLQMTFKWPFSMTNQEGSHFQIWRIKSYTFWYLICCNCLYITKVMVKNVIPTLLYWAQNWQDIECAYSSFNHSHALQ